MHIQDPKGIPDTDICIIGAGLSGLALAQALRADGRDVTVLEGRDRPGGRILSQAGHDLGPAWVWPQNDRMLALLRHLGLRTFPQHASGRLVFEDQAGRVRDDLDFATMGGALRVEGGLAQVTDALAAELSGALHFGCWVRDIVQDDHGVRVTTETQALRAGRVVLALPPRLAAGLGAAVPDVPTWMAGQAKLVATYPTPFWRGIGLNGDAISHLGPLVEIHDATPANAASGALFGFARAGAARLPEFSEDAVAQLVRLFGPAAATPVKVIVKDWSADPATATPEDKRPPLTHPIYQPLPPLGRIIFAGSEAAPEDGGFLEGALASADAALTHLRTVRA